MTIRPQVHEVNVSFESIRDANYEIMAEGGGVAVCLCNKDKGICIYCSIRVELQDWYH